MFIDFHQKNTVYQKNSVYQKNCITGDKLCFFSFWSEKQKLRKAGFQVTLKNTLTDLKNNVFLRKKTVFLIKHFFLSEKQGFVIWPAK